MLAVTLRSASLTLVKSPTFTSALNVPSALTVAVPISLPSTVKVTVSPPVVPLVVPVMVTLPLPSLISFSLTSKSSPAMPVMAVTAALTPTVSKSSANNSSALVPFAITLLSSCRYCPGMVNSPFSFSSLTRSTHRLLSSECEFSPPRPLSQKSSHAQEPSPCLFKVVM